MVSGLISPALPRAGSILPTRRGWQAAGRDFVVEVALPLLHCGGVVHVRGRHAPPVERPPGAIIRGESCKKDDEMDIMLQCAALLFWGTLAQHFIFSPLWDGIANVRRNQRKARDLDKIIAQSANWRNWR